MISLCLKPKLAKFLGRNDGIYPFGIIEYIILFCCYPIFNCDHRLGLALMCLMGGDGMAGIAVFLKTKKSIINPNKSYLGLVLCFVGSILYMYIYDHKWHVKLALLASFTEILPLGQHDNLFVTVICTLF